MFQLHFNYRLQMIDYKNLLNSFSGTELAPLSESLPAAIKAGLDPKRYGDLPGWLAALDALPRVEPSRIDCSRKVQIGARTDVSEQQWAQIQQALQALIPWRKGPYSVFDIEIDTEWRSDWKWDRLAAHIRPLTGKKVLDVGCGNGYHCWRMWGAGASQVIGIDPSPRFVVQFYMLKHFVGAVPVDVLPVGIEALPENLQAFDTTFSMGVLYHRRSPMDHLKELKDTLVAGGELVLETLVIDGGLGQTLVPEGRYAMMNNVWFLPSSATLVSWLKKVGFENIRVIDETVTTTEEQRRTEWMKFHSLREFLDPDDLSKTAEGHPAPKRAIVLADKPR